MIAKLNTVSMDPQRPDIHLLKKGDREGNRLRRALFIDTVLRLSHSRPRLLLHSTALMGMMALLAGVMPGHAAYPTSSTIDGGTTVTVPDDGPPNNWNPSALIVGQSGAGTLIIQDGGLVSSTGTANIGQNKDSNGSVTVSGVGSTWTNANRVYIGNAGNGTLDILAGATVSNSSNIGYIGFALGAMGTVRVAGDGSTWITPTLVVGEDGNGTLTIADGGIVRVTSSNVLVANDNVNGQSVINIGAAQGNPAVRPGWLDTSNVSLVSARGSLVFNHTDTTGTYLFTPRVSGAGTLIHVAGYTTLTADNAYTGGTTILGGTLQLGNAGTTGVIVGNVEVGDNGTLAFNRSDDLSYSGIISGGGLINQIGGSSGTGTLLLTGNSGAFAGTTNITGGALLVDGTLGNSSSSVVVASGSTLGGAGNIGGSVSVAGGGILAPGGAGVGQEVGILTINGDLMLNSGSILDYQFRQLGAAGGLLNDLIVVNGNLTLDGSLAITLPGTGSLDPGLYRIISYEGAFSGTALSLDPQLGADVSIGTSIQGAVDLIYSDNSTPIRFWDGDPGTADGSIDGGDGTWQASGDTNWTDQDGGANEAYGDSLSFAIFASASGRVNVDDHDGGAPVISAGMQFATSGYVIEGDPITLADGDNVIRVGDGTTLGAGYVATIASVLTGDGGINKTDAGTLVLTGDNDYRGGTTISAGTLQLGDGNDDDGTTGSIAGDVINNGTLVFNRSGTLIYGGVISGDGAVNQLGTGTTIFTGSNTYSGGTTISAGTLQLGNGGDTGSIVGAVLNQGTLAFNRTDAFTFTGVISGSGAVKQIGDGTTILSGINTYSGGTTILGGTLSIGSDSNLGAASGFLTIDGGTLRTTGTIDNFSRLTTIGMGGGTIAVGSGTLTMKGVISGTGALTKTEAGTLVWDSGSSMFSGVTNVAAGTFQVNANRTLGASATNVTGGTLLVNGTLGTPTSTVLVSSGGTLGGGTSATSGTIGGSVSVANGGILAPGQIGGLGRLTINGDLVLSDAAILNYQFGQADVIGGGGALNDLTVVNGDLTLDGILNVTVAPSGNFTPGMYRIFRYSGNLDDNNLTIGAMPSGSGSYFAIITSIGQEVNLLYSTTPMTLTFWDGDAAANKNNGTADGGDGIWSSVGNNWMNPYVSANGPYENPSVATFAGTAGTVTVDNSLGGAVKSSGMLFVSNGYVIDGDPITLASGSNVIQVGDGTVSGAGYVATIESNLTGDGGINKTDAGTLVLTGSNDYTGGTIISAGTLEVKSDDNLGDESGTLTMKGGRLYTTMDMISARNTTLESGGGTFQVATDTTLRMDGLISGAGALSKADSGTLVLTGDNNYSGGTTINAGALVLTGDNAYGSGSTTISSAGSLQLGHDTVNGGATGSISGNVTNNGTLIFNRSNELTYAGIISGGGTVNQVGLGTTILTGANSYSGGTTISAGMLQLGSGNGGGTAGSITGNISVSDSGTLAFNRSNTLTYGGVISGGGAINQIGGGATILTGNSGAFTGLARVTRGALLVNGTLGNADSTIVVSPGGTLGGGTGTVSGTIGGDVVINGGGILAPGGINAVGTLTINGNLALSDGALVNYHFGQTDVVGGAFNDLTVVGGDLTLDGTLNVTVPTSGSFDPGIYRIINYGGELDNQGLALGITPSGQHFAIITAIEGEVGLLYSATPMTFRFWDGDAGPVNNGVINGGDGIWSTVGESWTDQYGAGNGPYENPSFAIFTKPAGQPADQVTTVTVSNSFGLVKSSGMQFAAGGYLIQGDPITLETGVNPIRVGDGTVLGGSIVATIASELTGDGGINKTDVGTLVLTGNNSYTGDTTISGGTLRVNSDENLGDASGMLTFDGGTLNTSESFVSGRTTTLAAGGGTFDVDSDTTLTMNGLISGPGALTKADAGTLVLTNDNTYSGGSTINAGRLQLGLGNGGGATGSITGTIVNNGTLIFNRSNELTYDGVISGTGTVNQMGAGTTILTGTNTYSGGTTISAGTLQLGVGTGGGASGAITGNVVNNGTLIFNRSNNLTYGGVISGSGAINQIGGGATILAGDSGAFTGLTSVTGGTLLVNGTLGNASSNILVSSGGTLGGGGTTSGTLGGNVSIADGTLAPGGAGVGTLTINGNLVLGGSSILDYQFGAADVAGGTLNDLVVVGGNLTLDGTLNVSAASGGSFGPGLYRIFSYAGALTNNGLDLGTMLSSNRFAVVTATDKQVDLFYSPTPMSLSVWDGNTGAGNGIINGGDGIWSADAADTSWTNEYGSTNGPYEGSSFAIFAGTAGTVTVDDNNGTAPIESGGMQFRTSGYVIQGDPITLVDGSNIIRVGDGTRLGADYEATIDSELTGAGGINKTDAGTLLLTADNSYEGGTTVSEGTLVLAGNNSYTGGTTILVGTLRISDDRNLGDASGSLTVNGGTLNTTANLVSGRSTTLAAGGGTFDVDTDTTLTMGGIISGPGSLSKTDDGTLVLTGDDDYRGGTSIGAGTLQLGNGGVTGAIVGNVANNGTLVFNRSDGALILAGVISGSGAVEQAGTGTTTLTGNNSYTGTTTISDGTLVLTGANTSTGGTTILSGATLQLGNGGATGAITGNVLNNGTLAFNRSGTLSYGGVISGSGEVNQLGSGTTILTGNSNAFLGAAKVTDGVLQINGTLGAGVTDVTGGTLSVNGSLNSGVTNVTGGGTLAGTGIIAGDVAIIGGGILAPGGLEAGQEVGTLTINGDLALDAGSILNYDFGQAGQAGGSLNDLTVVNGHLTLDGSLNITAPSGGGLEPGIYHVFMYDKDQFTNNVLQLGSTPPGTNFSIATLIEGRIDLISIPTGMTFSYWDSASGIGNSVIDGGNGVWKVASDDYSWMDPSTSNPISAGYANGSFAIFDGEAGTVTVDNSGDEEVRSGGMQFVSQYVINGDPITLEDGDNIIRVAEVDRVNAPDYDAMISSDLTGNGGINKTDAGTLVLTGNNSYAGGTTISGGTLRISEDGNLGDPSGTLTIDGGTLNTTANMNSDRLTTLGTGGGTFAVDSGTALTMGGEIAGPGALSKTGLGALVLTGDNIYEGGTTIAAGALQLGDGGATGSIVGDVVNDGTLIFNRNNTLSYDGVISGAGAVEQIGAGTTVLTGNNSYQGGTTISGGTLRIGEDGNLGAASGALAIDGGTLSTSADLPSGRAVMLGASGGTFEVDPGTTLTLDGLVSGPGALSKTDAGILVLAGDNSYQGGTAISGGTLRISEDGNLGNASGSLTIDGGTLNTSANLRSGRAVMLGVNGGTFEVNPGTILMVDGVISGPGALGKTNAGALILTGDNSYTGGTAIAAGALVLGNGDAAGSIVGNVANNGTLVFNRSDTYSFGGVISGDGAVEQVGAGTTVFTGINSYSGETTVSGGVLDVAGSIASSAMTTVNSGARLVGTGSVGNTTIVRGGVFAPGNGAAGSSMTVAGDLNLQSGAQYVTWLNANTASLAEVRGRATLGGATTVNAIYANGGYVEKRYTILTAAGGVNGSFNGLINTNLPTGFQPSLEYDANDAYLDLTLNLKPPGGNLNGNESNVGDSLGNSFDSNGGIPLVFGTLTPDELTQVSGELATASWQTSFDAMGQFVALLSDPSVIGGGECSAAASDGNTQAAALSAGCQGWSTWTVTFGGERNTNGDTAVGSHDVMDRVYSVAAGAGYHLSPDTLVGFALAGGSTKFEIADGDLGSGSSELMQVGLFMQQMISDAYFRAAAAYGWQDITTERTLAISGIDRLQADFNTNAFSGRLEGGYRFETAWAGIMPYAAGEVTMLDLPGYNERTLLGSNQFALNYEGETGTAWRSELGLRAERTLATAGGALTLGGKVAWAHNFENERSMKAEFQSLPGTSFEVNGAAIDRDAALATVSLEMKWRGGWSVSAALDSEFSSVSRLYGGRALLRYQW